MRYVNLSTVLVFRLVSTKVKRRFPDYVSLVEAKLMLRKEVKQMENAEMLTPHEATWTPILWALKLLERARSEKKIHVNVSKTYLIDKRAILSAYRLLSSPSSKQIGHISSF